MADSAVPDREERSVAILFSQDAVHVIDIFRALGDFEEHYDVATLDVLEARLCSTMSRDAAKGIVSDALLLAFGLRRERSEPMIYKPVHSRPGTLDEYRLLAMISASYWHEPALAAKAATALDLAHPQPLISLAFDIARRLEDAGIKLQRPDPRLFQTQNSVPSIKVTAERLNATDLRLNFDF